MKTSNDIKIFLKELSDINLLSVLGINTIISYTKSIKSLFYKLYNINLSRYQYIIESDVNIVSQSVDVKDIDKNAKKVAEVLHKKMGKRVGSQSVPPIVRNLINKNDEFFDRVKEKIRNATSTTTQKVNSETDKTLKNVEKVHSIFAPDWRRDSIFVFFIKILLVPFVAAADMIVNGILGFIFDSVLKIFLDPNDKIFKEHSLFKKIKILIYRITSFISSAIKTLFNIVYVSIVSLITVFISVLFIVYSLEYLYGVLVHIYEKKDDIKKGVNEYTTKKEVKKNKANEKKEDEKPNVSGGSVEDIFGPMPPSFIIKSTIDSMFEKVRSFFEKRYHFLQNVFYHYNDDRIHRLIGNLLIIGIFVSLSLGYIIYINMK